MGGWRVGNADQPGVSLVGEFWVSKLVTFESDLPMCRSPSGSGYPILAGDPLTVRRSNHHLRRRNQNRLVLHLSEERLLAALFMLVYAGIDSADDVVYGGLLLGTFGPHQS